MKQHLMSLWPNVTISDQLWNAVTSCVHQLPVVTSSDQCLTSWIMQWASIFIRRLGEYFYFLSTLNIIKDYFEDLRGKFTDQCTAPLYSTLRLEVRKRALNAPRPTAREDVHKSWSGGREIDRVGERLAELCVSFCITSQFADRMDGLEMRMSERWGEVLGEVEKISSRVGWPAAIGHLSRKEKYDWRSERN